jgi:hypothetical protein
MPITLGHFGALQLLIELLQYKESLLFLTVVGYKTLSIEVVLSSNKLVCVFLTEYDVPRAMNVRGRVSLERQARRGTSSAWQS